MKKALFVDQYPANFLQRFCRHDCQLYDYMAFTRLQIYEKNNH